MRKKCTSPKVPLFSSLFSSLLLRQTMPSDSIENRTAAARSTASNPPPKLDEPLPCPRCDSRSTKFCYYNNYNLCQPRYFCKSCRRYWTHGGSLRNVPVGGGTRKSTKRSRPAPPATSDHSPDPPLTTPNGSSSSSMETVAVTPEPVSAVPVQEMKTETDVEHVNLNEGLGQYHGYLTLGGYGLDPFWMCSGGGGFLGGGGAVGGSPAFSSWQAAGDVDGGGGFIDGESFAWPGLTISSYGKSMK